MALQIRSPQPPLLRGENIEASLVPFFKLFPPHLVSAVAWENIEASLGPFFKGDARGIF
jgi:hypothetical protein